MKLDKSDLIGSFVERLFEHRQSGCLEYVEKCECIGKRAFLFITGILALFLWAGFLLGPALAILASLMPQKILAQKLIH